MVFLMILCHSTECASVVISAHLQSPPFDFIIFIFLQIFYHLFTDSSKQSYAMSWCFMAWVMKKRFLFQRLQVLDDKVLKRRLDKAYLTSPCALLPGRDTLSDSLLDCLR